MHWQAAHGRHDLPWQNTRDPYRVWLSEVMLQQTRVDTVLGYYARFLARFPDLDALADARTEAVLACWAGLGYYARARQLHRCARLVRDTLAGRFPERAQELAQLPGIGPSTAAAIAAFCFSERGAILDGNVKRVLARHFGIAGDPRQAATLRAYGAAASAVLPPAPDIGVYTQAIMDLGAGVCTRHRPQCPRCPVRSSCAAHAAGRVEDYPGRSAARPRPRREAHLLLVLQRGAALLEQRPASGLWGGLLSPPQFVDAAALRRHARRYGAGVPQAGAAREHGFTHFTLHYTPHVLRLPPRGRPAAPPGQRWLPLAQAEQAALAAPIRELLRDLRENSA